MNYEVFFLCVSVTFVVFPPQVKLELWKNFTVLIRLMEVRSLYLSNPALSFKVY